MDTLDPQDGTPVCHRTPITGSALLPHRPRFARSALPRQRVRSMARTRTAGARYKRQVIGLKPTCRGACRDVTAPRVFARSDQPHEQGGLPLAHMLTQTGYSVEIRPLLVTTIQRWPQRTIDSTPPTPGKISPRFTLQTPLGPSKMAVPPTTSRTIQPSIVVGLVSGNGIGFEEAFGWRSTLDVAVGAALCCRPGEDLAEPGD